MTSKAISIYANQLYLSEVLHLPDRAYYRKVPLIVLLHGFVGSKVSEHRLFVKVAWYFTVKGYADSDLFNAYVGEPGAKIS